MSTHADSTGKIPETPVDKLRDVVAGLIDVVTTQGGKAIDTLGLRPPGRQWIPDIDVVETGNELVVTVDLPGIDPQSVEILLAGNLLTVKGNTSAADVPAGAAIHRRERPVGEFDRTLSLPATVSPEQVSADSRHGVLTIRLAKVALAAARQIPIQITPPMA
ncbi:MAG: Hsp20/alpha crystallin family protein [Planctomycetaceae bacterium]|nr:Hsp20/alpha crystallin family protein [Planctomycetaceae bacterium]